jgi:hypothetical protein
MPAQRAFVRSAPVAWSVPAAFTTVNDVQHITRSRRSCRAVALRDTSINQSFGPVRSSLPPDRSMSRGRPICGTSRTFAWVESRVRAESGHQHQAGFGAYLSQEEAVSCDQLSCEVTVTADPPKSPPFLGYLESRANPHESAHLQQVELRADMVGRACTESRQLVPLRYWTSCLHGLHRAALRAHVQCAERAYHAGHELERSGVLSSRIG